MEAQNPDQRINLLADIAEMYFLEGKNQAEIAKMVGMTRSNVSRLLKEARESGIIEIQINRPVSENPELAQQMVERFNLIAARIVDVDRSNQLLDKLGGVAADELVRNLMPGQILGTAWGTGISATVEHLEPTTAIPSLKVIQLLGALGAHIRDYDAHAIVRRLEDKLDAEGIYFNAPFFVEDETIANLILETKSLTEPLNMAKRADVALLGVGSLDIDHCSYYLAGYLSDDEIYALQDAGAVGDVCAVFFDRNGNLVEHELKKRMIGISAQDLLDIPIRIAAAGGPAKVDPILGALRAKLINVLITDSATAATVLKRAKTE